jgi:hypothetical protein
MRDGPPFDGAGAIMGACPRMPTIAIAVQSEAKTSNENRAALRILTCATTRKATFLHINISQNVLGNPNGHSLLVREDMSTRTKRQTIGLVVFLLAALIVVATAAAVGASAVDLQSSDHGFLHTTNIGSVATNPFGSSSSPIQVISVVGPIAPFNPGGPVVSVTIKNISGNDVTLLNASLALGPAEVMPGNIQRSYSFVFNASPSNPLRPGQSTTSTEILIGAGFETDRNYPLTINGTLANGTEFSYTAQVQIV